MGASAGPRSVVEGLVMALDAANEKSYPGTGFDWLDLSSNNNNVELFNGVAYNSDNKGYMSFDGVNDYASYSQSSSLFPGPSISASIDCWIKPATSSGTHIYIGVQNPGGHRIYVANYNGLWDLGFGGYAWNGNFSGTRSSVQLEWTHICVAIDSGIAKLYINSKETITKTSDTSVSLTGIFSIGAYFFLGNFDQESGQSSISLVKTYNYALSAGEIKQNFQATRSRYAL